MEKTAPSRNDSLAHFVPWWNKSDNVVSPFHWCIRQTVPPSSGFPTHTFHSCVPASCSTDITPCRPPSLLRISNQSSPYTPRSPNCGLFHRGERSAIIEHSSPHDRRVSQCCRSAMPTAIAGSFLIVDQS